MSEEPGSGGPKLIYDSKIGGYREEEKRLTPETIAHDLERAADLLARALSKMREDILVSLDATSRNAYNGSFVNDSGQNEPAEIVVLELELDNEDMADPVSEPQIFCRLITITNQPISVSIIFTDPHQPYILYQYRRDSNGERLAKVKDNEKEQLLDAFAAGTQDMRDPSVVKYPDAWITEDQKLVPLNRGHLGERFEPLYGMYGENRSGLAPFPSGLLVARLDKYAGDSGNGGLIKEHFVNHHAFSESMRTINTIVDEFTATTAVKPSLSLPDNT